MVIRKVGMAATVFALMFSAQAQAQGPAPRPESHRGGQCFFINQLEGWRAADDRTIYIRVGVRDFYRLDLAGSCPNLTLPDAHLITRTRGPQTVCSAVDWDLSVNTSGPGAIPTPCIVSSMRKLGPAEAAALPKKLRP